MIQLFAQALPLTQRKTQNALSRACRSYSFLYCSPMLKPSIRNLNRVTAISFSRIRDIDDDSFRATSRPRRAESRVRSRGREKENERRDFNDFSDRRAQRVRELKEKVAPFARRDSGVNERIIASDEDYDDEIGDDIDESFDVSQKRRSRGGREVNPADRVFGRRGEEVVSDDTSGDEDKEEEGAVGANSWARDRRRGGKENRRSERISDRSERGGSKGSEGSGGRGDLSRRDRRDDWRSRPNPRRRGDDVSSGRPDRRERGSEWRRGEGESFSRRETRKDLREKEEKEPIYGHYDGDHLYGISPVLAALKAKRRKISELFVQKGKDLAKSQEREIVTLAKALGIPTREFDKHDLNMMSGNRPHQGFVLRAQPLDYVSLDKTPLPNHHNSSSNRLILALDEVMDPQNLGALLRTCHYLGCSTVVVSEKNSAPLSAVVSKASSGAVELMTVYSTKNMMTLVDRAKDEGWLVVGTAMKGKTSVTMKEVPRDRPVLLVLGNEGYGLRTNVQTRCDFLVNIPSSSGVSGDVTTATVSSDVTASTTTAMKKSEESDSLVDSLNVSVSGGILLHYFLNRGE